MGDRGGRSPPGGRRRRNRPASEADGARSHLAFILAFAGGAILTMLATSVVPEAYEHAGRRAGLANVLGFAVAVLVTWLDS